MFAHPTKMLRYGIAAAVALACVCIAPLAFAKVALNTIDAVGIVTDNGRHVALTGPLACAEREPAYLRVTVTQRFAFLHTYSVSDCGFVARRRNMRALPLAAGLAYSVIRYSPLPIWPEDLQKY